MTRNPSTVVLVEGPSDKAALEALVARRTGDGGLLPIVAMGGATNVGRYLDDAIRRGQRVAGLCDSGEESDFARALEAAGLGTPRTRSDLAALGFFVCEPDLEAELIRALGADRILAIITGQRDDLRRFRTLQYQPEWRDRPIEEQLRRWFGSGGSRKIRYASLLAEATHAGSTPVPLTQLLDYASGGS